jgi:uncharacterized membrane protein YciS (DUF1049 family)
MRRRIWRYLWKYIVPMSICINVVTGGAKDQTFSARNWYWKRNGKYNIVIIIDLVFGDGHCMMSWVNFTLKKGEII